MIALGKKTNELTEKLLEVMILKGYYIQSQFSKINNFFTSAIKILVIVIKKIAFMLPMNKITEKAKKMGLLWKIL